MRATEKLCWFGLRHGQPLGRVQTTRRAALATGVQVRQTDPRKNSISKNGKTFFQPLSVL
jgi:hypothetical protein